MTASADQPTTRAGPSSASASVTPESPTPTATSNAAISVLIRRRKPKLPRTMYETVTPSTHAVAPWDDPRSSTRVHPSAVASAAFRRSTDADETRKVEMGTRSSYPIAATTKRAPVEREHRERQEEVVSVPRPVHELWRADQEGAEREPAPALPQKSSDRRDERNDHESERQSRRLATDEDGCRECAEQGERGDELRSPPNGDRRAGPTDDSGDEEPGFLADDLLHGGRVRQRRVERGERARDGGDRRFGLASPLVEKQAGCEKDRRAGERERDPCLDPDPATIDGDHEEEDDSDDDREPAEPRQDPSAEQILERRLRSVGFGVGLIPRRLFDRAGRATGAVGSGGGGAGVATSSGRTIGVGGSGAGSAGAGRCELELRHANHERPHEPLDLVEPFLECALAVHRRRWYSRSARGVLSDALRPPRTARDPRATQATPAARASKRAAT